MNDESFINAVNYTMSKQAGLHDRLGELKAAYIADNSVLKYGQRVWVNGKLYGLTSIRLTPYTQRVHITYTLRPYVKDGSRVGGNGASIRLNSSYMEDWVNTSVEKP